MKTYQDQVEEAIEILSSPSIRAVPKGDWSVEWRRGPDFVGEGRLSPAGAVASIIMLDGRLVYFKGQAAAQIVSARS